LEPVKAKFPDLSYADLYTYAGVVAVEEAGGPKIPYKTGREDFTDGSTSDMKDRLPNADYGGRDKNVSGMRAIFNRMGFDDQEIVALLGAHAMGRCHTNASGFWGPWTNAETTFSNEYFRLLLEERCVLKCECMISRFMRFDVASLARFRNSPVGLPN
jgi:cytochrome c peroxidase